MEPAHQIVLGGAAARVVAMLSFLMVFITGNVGWIEVICGPMFSGKSEELIRRLRGP